MDSGFSIMPGEFPNPEDDDPFLSLAQTPDAQATPHSRSTSYFGLSDILQRRPSSMSLRSPLNSPGAVLPALNQERSPNAGSEAGSDLSFRTAAVTVNGDAPLAEGWRELTPEPAQTMDADDVARTPRPQYLRRESDATETMSIATATANANPAVENELRELKARLDKLEHRDTYDTYRSRPSTGSTSLATSSNSNSLSSPRSTNLHLASVRKLRGVISPEVFKTIEDVSNEVTGLCEQVAEDGSPVVRRRADGVRRALTDVCVALLEDHVRTTQLLSPLRRRADPDAGSAVYEADDNRSYISGSSSRLGYRNEYSKPENGLGRSRTSTFDGSRRAASVASHGREALSLRHDTLLAHDRVQPSYSPRQHDEDSKSYVSTTSSRWRPSPRSEALLRESRAALLGRSASRSSTFSSHRRSESVASLRRDDGLEAQYHGPYVRDPPVQVAGPRRSSTMHFPPPAPAHESPPMNAAAQRRIMSEKAQRRRTLLEDAGSRAGATSAIGGSGGMRRMVASQSMGNMSLSEWDSPRNGSGSPNAYMADDGDVPRRRL
ncbi:hypothetical protein SAICODRAFT_163856 [Saitoella complicata NRRL Y-17804]|nr:uncharacterized protein SAICODRAFT_163856 [Saitoella complicata NRRL Y-17804]ODQ50833.1 hypothetical protein SAICODRAFT_163856 [Saitoella complicata NRRL Y-17804]